MAHRNLFLCISFLLASVWARAQWNEVNDFGPNPGKLVMFTYGHADDTGHTPKPLVIVLHGCGQGAKDVAQLTGWNKLADLNDFWVLYPQQQLRNNSGACFNWFRPKDIEKGSGECESIYQMSVYLKTHEAIDENRVYITGLSAGGAMTTVMLATHPEAFAAGAVFAGGAYKAGKNALLAMASMAGINGSNRQTLMYRVLAQNPSYTGKYPFLIVYQGLSDPIVNPKNADLLITQWTGVHKSSPYPTRTDSSYNNIPGLIRSEYTNPAGEVVVLAYRVKNMGHQVPVNPGNLPTEGGTAGIFGSDKNFHSTYQTALEFGLIKTK